jgi:hypothetical protein
LTGSQLAAFTVGLLDGIGQLQVNCSKQGLQLRLACKLQSTPANKAMLQQIAAVYGGYVKTGCNSLQ